MRKSRQSERQSKEEGLPIEIMFHIRTPYTAWHAKTNVQSAALRNGLLPLLTSPL